MGINDTGNVAGDYKDGAGTHGFIYDGASYTTLNVPGADGTIAIGINDTGNVAGRYWVGSEWHGFIFDGASYTTLNVPGADGTYAYGINDTGNVVGSYWVGAEYYGFIAMAEPGDPTYRSSVPEPSSILLLGSGLAGFAGIGIMKRRKKG